MSENLWFKETLWGHYHSLFGSLSLKNKSIEKSGWLQNFLWKLPVPMKSQTVAVGLSGTIVTVCTSYTVYGCARHMTCDIGHRLPFHKGSILCFAKRIES